MRPLWQTAFVCPLLSPAVNRTDLEVKEISMDHNSISKPTLLCDFCNHPDVVRSYDAAPVAMKVADTFLYYCDNKWVACGTCARLIDEDRWDDLSRRSFDLWLRAEHLRGNHPSLREQAFMKIHLPRLHGYFREARRRTA